MEIGIAVGRIERATLEDDLKAWQQAGIVAVEIDYPPLVENPPRVLDQWAQMFRDAQIQLWSVHAPFGGQHNLAHPEERVRARAVEYHKFVLERAKRVGAQFLVIHPSGSARSESERGKAWDWLRESLDELLPFAEDLEIVLAVENMLPDAAIGADPAELNGFLAAYFSPYLRLCFDTGHAHIAGNVYLWLESLAPAVATYHLQDNDRARDLHLPPGYGTIPWDLLSPLLQQATFPLIVEAYRWQNSSWQVFCQEVKSVLTGQVVTAEVEGQQGVVRCFRCGRLMVRWDGKIKCGCE